MAGEAPAARTTESDAVALAALLLARCRQLRLSLAVAESCTGGLVGHLLTEVPGSSGVFVGGAITYSDVLKRDLLGVPEGTLLRHGAVSAQVAVAMAEGIRQRFGTGVGMAVTGIAGPDGGSAAKPIGLTYVAVADSEGHDGRRHQWTGDRSANKLASAIALMELVLDRLEPVEAPPEPIEPPRPGRRSENPVGGRSSWSGRPVIRRGGG